MPPSVRRKGPSDNRARRCTRSGWEPARVRTVDLENLETLTVNSGGYVEDITDPSEITAAVARIFDELQSQYTSRSNRRMPTANTTRLR